jgi:hypothetical protein
VTHFHIRRRTARHTNKVFRCIHLCVYLLFSLLSILSRVGVTIDGFWIGWLDLLHFIHSQSSGLQAITAYSYSTHFPVHVTHALGFSVFISLILVTDLSQSHCNFYSHMKSSCHSVIPFFPLLCNCQFRRLDSIQLQAHILAGWRPEARTCTSDSTALLLLLGCCSFYYPSARTPWKTQSILLRRRVYWSVA